MERQREAKGDQRDCRDCGDEIHMQIQNYNNILWRDRERPKETKESLETVETSGGTWKYYAKRQ